MALCIALAVLLFMLPCMVCYADPMQPWAGAAVSGWDRRHDSIFLTDMTQAKPTAFSKELEEGRWKVMPYVAIPMNDAAKRAGAWARLEGTMVWAGPETRSPALTLSLGVTGWHALFVGLFSTAEAPTKALLRLDADSAAQPRYNRASQYYGNIEDVFFKAAHLTKASSLTFAPQTLGYTEPCGIAYIRLIPLSEAEIAHQEHEGPPARTLIATHDGFSPFYHASPRNKEGVAQQISAFGNTDFGTIILQSLGGDKTNYPSKVGSMKGLAGAAVRLGDRYYAESIDALAKKGIHPLKTLIEGSHDLGLETFVSIRPAGWSFFEPFAGNESPFYTDHPEWRTVDRDGSKITRMSWAVPEVRQHMIALLIEQVGFGPGGVHICFNRGVPVALYEPPAAKLFEQQHGVDMHSVPESDPRIRGLWADIVTAFFEELRAALGQEQARLGLDRKLPIGAIFYGNEADNLRFGLDVPRLVEAGLLDAVMADACAFGASKQEYEYDYLRRACESRGVPFYPQLAAHRPMAERLAQVVAAYEAGAAGMLCWDAEPQDAFDWMLTTRLGRLEEVRWRSENLDPANPPRSRYRFEKLGSHDRGVRFGPWWGG